MSVRYNPGSCIISRHVSGLLIQVTVMTATTEVLITMIHESAITGTTEIKMLDTLGAIMRSIMVLSK